MSTSWQRILVPLDFSDDSITALQRARDLAETHDSNLVLLHVVEPAFQGLRIQTEASHSEAERMAQQKFQGVMNDYLSALQDRVSVEVRDGRPGDAICRAAEDLNADLICIATHGISAIRHFMLGSVAEKVVRHAPCSVLLVR
ncbi:MAG: universal stress protein [Verrucomicrobiaceae bacterium]|nr:universal stress protein [Verrucomicrobiaceae bacterium]